jgi:hypothetical protein
MNEIHFGQNLFQPIMNQKRDINTRTEIDCAL